MRIVRSHFNHIENLIAEIDSAIDAMVEKQENIISLLRTIPGVDRFLGFYILSRLAKKCSFAGFCLLLSRYFSQKGFY